MINPRVALLYKNIPHKYPHFLQRDYPHVLNRLMQLWCLPEFEPYMYDLMMDKRGDRQGFPLEVVSELVFLGELHEAFKREGYQLPNFEDPWKAVPVENPSPEGFMSAIERGQREVMEIFLSAGVSVDYRFEGGQTALMVAVINGQAEMVHSLIEDGAGVNLRDRGRYTALHWAAFYKQDGMIDELLRFGAEINAVQNSGDTPLSLAVTRGHVATVRLLLLHKADPNIRSHHGTPLAIAHQRKTPRMIELLTKFGARA
ncbi:MAG: ankyrin repeat domain-containing protein [Gallionella sp.]|nr:ankyrin repeat domain-containing protein [Gallionella sp.]